MSIAQSALARVVPALADVLRRPLSLQPLGDAVPDAFVLRLVSPALQVVADDGLPLAAAERRLLGEVMNLVRIADETSGRFVELEQRMLSLKQENFTLVARNATLAEIAARDSLTGLYNRSYVVEKLESEINRALRHNSPTALLMLDIDHFKQVNDNYGHLVGDQVLQWVGRILRDSCRVYDVPARYGGEEFCVVLPETPVGNTTTVAERIRAKFAGTELTFGDATIRVTASFGVAGLDASSEETVLSSNALIDRADRAMYVAKNRGRNRIEFWPMGADSAREH